MMRRVGDGVVPGRLVAACGVACAMAWLGSTPALGQDGGAAQSQPANGRRVLDGPPTTLTFRDASVEDLVPFIVEATGKVVIVPEMRLPARITVVSDTPVPRNRALDLVVLALQQDGIAVVETEDIIILRDINEVVRQDVPVIGPNQSVLGRTDLGSMAEKVYRIRYSQAKALADALEDVVPEYAKITVDESSNHIAVLGNIGLLKRIESLIQGMDQPGSRALVTRTFRLRYADAELIAQNITDLFGQSSTQTQAQQGRNANLNRFFGRGRDEDEASIAGVSTADLRVTANTQQNAVTVGAEQGVLDQIAELIRTEWDLPLPEETVTPRIYTLENSDPIAVRDVLVGLFGEPSATTGGSTAGGAGPGAQGNRAATSGSSQGVGRLAGQFAFEAIPSAGQIAVVAKSPDNLAVIDQIIAELDKPKTVGLPAIVSLKHVSAEEVAEQLNALLALDGTLASIPRSESGLSTGGGASASPFASDADETTATASDAQDDPGTITFWWQTAREQTDTAGASNLIGKLRIVPVWRQNAIMVLSPPEYRNAVVDLIRQLDQPGRQVLIQAVIAEVSRDDAEAIGLRWSSSAINLSRTDNSIAFVSEASGTENNVFGNLFDTSVLNVGVDLNAVLQALAERTSVSILSRPIIFTSDNQEAEFFDGQDIPFITNAQTTDTGGTTQGFEYRAVGIQPAGPPTPDAQQGRGPARQHRAQLGSPRARTPRAARSSWTAARPPPSSSSAAGRRWSSPASCVTRTGRSSARSPLLGDIPLLGWLFRSRESSVSTTEQLIFITPRGHREHPGGRRPQRRLPPAPEAPTRADRASKSRWKAPAPIGPRQPDAEGPADPARRAGRHDPADRRHAPMIAPDPPASPRIAATAPHALACARTWRCWPSGRRWPAPPMGGCVHDPARNRSAATTQREHNPDPAQRAGGQPGHRRHHRLARGGGPASPGHDRVRRAGRARGRSRWQLGRRPAGPGTPGLATPRPGPAARTTRRTAGRRDAPAPATGNLRHGPGRRGLRPAGPHPSWARRLYPRRAGGIAQARRHAMDRPGLVAARTGRRRPARRPGPGIRAVARA
ncbi:MAG: hypothetical protein KatS3mg103_0893 [Phycisphaerales bacterium]|nr:MAG: hypothetical protein KatS3mg103_0893 [Phycisphaerales bacterium]